MDRPLRLLIVEDSEDDTLLLVRELERGGYKVIFERVDTPEALHAALDHQPWDIVISDYSMPHFSGTAALKLVKGKGLDMPDVRACGSWRKSAPWKGAGLQRVQLPPGNWFAPPGSNRNGSGGNEAVGAFDGKGR